MTKLQEIARAMYAAVNTHIKPSPDWDNLTPISQGYWNTSARAAVEAMREPGQISCLHTLATVAPKLFLDNQLRYQDAVWYERINAILNEKP